jgi:hypothetical protein
LEHTLLVTVVGIEILRGMKLSRQLDPEEYAHMLIACLLHDIGYVSRLLKKSRVSAAVGLLDVGLMERDGEGRPAARLVSCLIIRSRLVPAV